MSYVLYNSVDHIRDISSHSENLTHKGNGLVYSSYHICETEKKKMVMYMKKRSNKELQESFSHFSSTVLQPVL